MGSRVMHSIIAYRLAQHFELEDRASFVMGGIAPDAVNDKELTHYYYGDVQDFTRGIDPERFLRSQTNPKLSPFILGYYTHLVADDLWLKGFYLSWLKNRMNADSSLYERYHGDFKMLNGQLLHYYGLKNELLQIVDEPFKYLDVTNVSRHMVEGFIPSLKEDMSYNEREIQAPLTVFTLQQIIGYIETSIEMGIQKMELLFEGRT
ncbi:hydrolase [Bacillus sp. BHET2]|uniref:zinc dependent phospholipase C family protein n=1 Tax=Bacillus sp. BHET2 TaxID=2583818 RepID=UPI00110EDD1D|nr:zinc dependent phospholipase C family protein [Bacillus sp. BHET2]TMU87622.1 hydrolase [Bacillus sp. BHET2]